MSKDNVTQVSIESECNITNKKDHDSANINHENCSYCNKPFIEELWCKECDPRCNHDIDTFIKDTIYDTRKNYDKDDARFLEWVQFDRFEDIRRIGVGGFAQVYSATWIDGQAEYYKLDFGSWKKSNPKPIEVALKRPTAEELYDILNFWWHSSDINSFRYTEYQKKEVFGYKGKEIKVIFDEADKEIPNILISYEKNPDAIYTSRIFTFNNLPKPVNSSIITSYINDEENNIDFQDSQLIDLEISNSLNLNEWTSENSDIDEFIKNTIYNAKYSDDDDDDYDDDYPLFLEWIPYDRFNDIKKIGEGGFAKVYSATWIDGKAIYTRNNGSWKKGESEPIKVALKKLNGSQNMSDEYLNELKTHWGLYNSNTGSLNFHGITRDPNTIEFMMVMQYASQGNLRCVLSNNFNKILWEDKLLNLMNSAYDLKNLHELGYIHKDFHTLDICNGLRPEFGKGTPEVYKTLAYKCMNANPDQRPTASELYNILHFWHNSTFSAGRNGDSKLKKIIY
ncbi:kinase-like domain-containing protein [Rhizophagus irregularis DAOM 181602=DAOM 197198]|nr:kinase-like domain-containing protein [Rhizophagus irregularis DAOM 181602=DAOM 197198]